MEILTKFLFNGQPVEKIISRRDNLILEKQKVRIDTHQVLIKVLELRAVITNPVGVFTIMIITLSLRVNLEAKARDVIEKSQF